MKFFLMFLRLVQDLVKSQENLYGFFGNDDINIYNTLMLENSFADRRCEFKFKKN